MAVGAYVLVRAAVEVRAAREAVRLCVEALMLTVMGVEAVSASEVATDIVEVGLCCKVEGQPMIRERISSCQAVEVFASLQDQLAVK